MRTLLLVVLSISCGIAMASLQVLKQVGVLEPARPAFKSIVGLTQLDGTLYGLGNDGRIRTYDESFTKTGELPVVLSLGGWPVENPYGVVVLPTYWPPQQNQLTSDGTALYAAVSNHRIQRVTTAGAVTHTYSYQPPATDPETQRLTLYSWSLTYDPNTNTVFAAYMEQLFTTGQGTTYTYTLVQLSSTLVEQQRLVAWITTSPIPYPMYSVTVAGSLVYLVGKGITQVYDLSTHTLQPNITTNTIDGGMFFGNGDDGWGSGLIWLHHDLAASPKQSLPPNLNLKTQSGIGTWTSLLTTRTDVVSTAHVYAGQYLYVACGSLLLKIGVPISYLSTDVDQLFGLQHFITGDGSALQHQLSAIGGALEASAAVGAGAHPCIKVLNDGRLAVSHNEGGESAFYVSTDLGKTWGVGDAGGQ